MTWPAKVSVLVTVVVLFSSCFRKDYTPYVPPPKQKLDVCVPRTRTVHVKALLSCNGVQFGPERLDKTDKIRIGGDSVGLDLSVTTNSGNLAERRSQCTIAGKLPAVRTQLQTAMERAYQARGYVVVDSVSNADFLAEIAMELNEVVSIGQVSAFGGNEDAYRCAKRCNQTSCSGFQWIAYMSNKTTIVLKSPSGSVLRSVQFEAKKDARNFSKSGNSASSDVVYFCNAEDAKKLLTDSSLYEFPTATKEVLKTTAMEVQSAICYATGPQRVITREAQREVTRWVPTAMTGMGYSLGTTEIRLGDVDVTVRLLNDCSNDGLVNIRGRTLGKVQVCAVPQFGHRVLLIQVKVKNGTRHVLRYPGMVPVLTLPDGRNLKPIPAVDALRHAWYNKTNDGRILVPRGKGRYAWDRVGDTTARMGVLDGDSGWGVLSMVLPGQTEIHVLAFELPDNFSGGRVALNIFDIPARTNRAGEVILKDSVSFPISVHPTSKSVQVATTVTETVTISVQPGETQADVAKPAGAAPTSPLAESDSAAVHSPRIAVSSKVGLVDVLDFLKAHSGKTVAIVTRKETTVGLLKGVWSLKARIQTKLGEKDIRLDRIRSVEVVGSGK